MAKTAAELAASRAKGIAKATETRLKKKQIKAEKIKRMQARIKEAREAKAKQNANNAVEVAETPASKKKVKAVASKKA